MTLLESHLQQFRDSRGWKQKGQLAVALHVTRVAREHGLPLDSETMVTSGTGQVAGLSKGRVQSILRDHGIDILLAREGGRTSRGSLGNMREYVDFLNALHGKQSVDLAEVEQWWVERVREFFSAKPFVLKFDPSRSLRSIVQDLLDQALKRQKDNPGTTYAGIVLQHLVGAKLDLVLPTGEGPRHHSASAADGPTQRAGDFVIDSVAIHVTTSPSEALLRKCKDNLESGLRPIIVTIEDGRAGVESIAKCFGIEGRIDVIEAEQFIATNVLDVEPLRNSRPTRRDQEDFSSLQRDCSACGNRPFPGCETVVRPGRIPGHNKSALPQLLDRCPIPSRHGTAPPRPDRSFRMEAFRHSRRTLVHGRFSRHNQNPLASPLPLLLPLVWPNPLALA